jgi:peroxidase
MGLTTIHTLWVREHNRIAEVLNKLNPAWDDERLFQEARRIVVAQIQHITYNEYLPALLGSGWEAEAAARIYGGQQSAATRVAGEYDKDLDPSIANEFAGAAYRFGHSTVQVRQNLKKKKNITLNTYCQKGRSITQFS